MKNDHFVASSRWVFARLLKLYPREHRAEYGADMLQVFTDQCRAVAMGESGRRRFIWRMGLWARTLFDLLVNVAREHLTAPNARLGLLEAPPNGALPWKGVALTLIPGVIFFVSQVGQLTGTDWFYWLMYRGAYFMILPVLAVWLWKRKFPIWGLMPLGLLYKTLSMAGFRFQYLGIQPSILPSSFFRYFEEHPLATWLAVDAAMLLGCIVLLRVVRRRGRFSGWVFVWLGLYLLVMFTEALLSTWDFMLANGLDWGTLFFSAGDATHRADAWRMTSYELYSSGGFLVLILLGALLARRHGRLAALLPLGYLLSIALYGPVSNDWPGQGTPEFSFMLTVAGAALVYRFTVALAGPLWIVRSSTGKMQQRAGVASLLLLIGIQAVFNIWLIFDYYRWPISGWSFLFSQFADQLILMFGVCLALALYGGSRAEPAAPLEATAVFNEPI